MNIRDAILRAADLIEGNPALYDFHEVHVPECSTPGCVLGWIGFIAKVKMPYNSVGFVAEMYLNLDAIKFYNRMSDINRTIPNWHKGPVWSRDAKIAARCMRIYADKYHPAQRPTSVLVSELMAKVLGEKIPEDA